MRRSPNELQDGLLRKVVKAVKAHDMLATGDHVLVALSGGKDSAALLHLLATLRRRSPVSFRLTAGHVDQGLPGRSERITEMARHAEALEVPFHVLDRSHHQRLLDERIGPGASRCPLCARLRRGALRSLARAADANVIALGHHRDDLVETLLLNILYAGRIRGMSPILPMAGGALVLVRPLYRCSEDRIQALATGLGITPGSTAGCGERQDLHRAKVKALIRHLQEENHRVPGNMLAALANVEPSTLMDPSIGEGGVKRPASSYRPDR